MSTKNKTIHVILDKDNVPLAAYNNHIAAVEHFKFLQKKEPCIIITFPIDMYFNREEWE